MVRRKYDMPLMSHVVEERGALRNSCMSREL